MKFNHIIVSGLCLLGLGFTACDNQSDAEYTPAETAQSAEIYLTPDMTTAFRVGETDTQISFPVYRSDSEQTATYPLTITCAEATLFTIPTEVSFEAGSDVAEAVIGFDARQLTNGNTYNFEIKVGEGKNTPYWNQTATVTLTYEAWIDVVGPNGEEYATYTDGFVDTWFNVQPVPYQVKMQQHPTKKGVYRLVNPYGEAYPYNEPGDYDTTEDHYFYFNVTNPNSCFICDRNGNANNGSSMVVFETGMDWNPTDYGQFIFTGLYNLLMAQGKPTDAAPNAGTYKDGCLTFPERSLLARMDIYTAAGNWTYANTKGNFRLLWPGASEPVEENKWEGIGTAEYTECVLANLTSQAPMTYQVEMEQNTDDPGKFRMVNPYKEGVCPVGYSYSGDKYIEIDASKPECVVLDEQEFYNIPEEPFNGVIEILNLACFRMLNGQSAEQIIAAGENDIYTADNMTITFAPGHLFFFLPQATDEQYKGYIFLGNKETTSKIVMSSTATSAAKTNALSNLNYTYMLKRAINDNVMNVDLKANRKHFSTANMHRAGSLRK